MNFDNFFKKVVDDASCRLLEKGKEPEAVVCEIAVVHLDNLVMCLLF